MDGNKYPKCVEKVEKYERPVSEGGGTYVKIYYNNGLVIEQPEESEIIDIDNQEIPPMEPQQSDNDVIMGALADIYELVSSRES